MKNWYQYERLPDNNVRLLRAFGMSPVVVIPDEICGMPVTEIGVYCFSQTNRVVDCEVYAEESQENRSIEELNLLRDADKIRELSGKFLQSIVLPDTVVALGSLAFYQCSCLKEIVIGKRLIEIGSDVFMNCRRLKNIIVHGSVTQPSGLKQILAQRDRETKVVFQSGEETESVLIYPEYTESYDEIGPAHIFSLNIEGEGFRARQCFQDGIVDLAQYDAVFEQASVRESEKTLCRMALMRLFYPVALLPERKRMYESYVKEHATAVGTLLVNEKNSTMLQFLIRKDYLKREDRFACLQAATAINWAEGVRELLQYQEVHTGESASDGYDFEAF